MHNLYSGEVLTLFAGAEFSGRAACHALKRLPESAFGLIAYGCCDAQERIG